MGFKIVGRKNGKKTVSDNPDDDATKVTSALKSLVEPEPSAASKGSTIRFMWDPKTGDSLCWIQGEINDVSNLAKRLKRIKLSQKMRQ